MHLSAIARVLAVVGLTSAILLGVAASADREGQPMAEFRLGGKSADEEFEDARVAALVRASCIGDIAEANKQIGMGANANFISREGVSPLLWALVCANPDGIEVLLRAGANPNYFVPRIDGVPPKGGYSAVLGAAALKDSRILKLLLKYGGNPNAEEIGGSETALTRALAASAQIGWTNYYLLLDAGADINRVHAKQTIADYAASLGQFDKVLELLNRGYTHDLNNLGQLTQSHYLYAGDPQIGWKKKVMTLLEKKGIKFPITSNFQRRNSGFATMREDGTIKVGWWKGRRGREVVEAREELIAPSDPGYESLKERLGGLAIGESKFIPRRSEDPEPIADNN